LVSYVTLKAMNPGDDYYTWNDFGHFNYLRLVEGADYEQLESKLMPWLAGYLDWDEQTLERMETTNDHMKLQPVVDIHLRSDIRWELSQNGNIGYVYIMSAAGIFILIIASFNFMNLTTARSMERAGEIGVRKAMGANKGSLYLQFLGESVLMAGMAIILAGLIVEVALPSFNAFTSKDLQLNVSHPSTIILLLSAAAIVGMLSGLYPAAFLSSLKPVLILKGKQSRSGEGKLVRKSLVTMQFAISMFLISGVAIIYQQMNYLNNKSLGFDKEAIVVIPIKTDETRERFETLQTQVNSIDGVLSISAASNIPGKQFNQNPIWKDSDPRNLVSVKQFMVDYEIFKTLDLELLDGRTFSTENPLDTTNFIVNESAMKSLNLGDTLGSPITLDMDSRMVEGTVIGVVKDFHYQSLHQPIRPLVFQLIPAYNFALVRIKMDDFNNTISNVASTWNGFDGNFDFEYDFLDETLDQQYAKEEKMGIVFGSFAVLAIIIACLGLGAMASIDFSSRKKEIGIKKVLGAPSANLIINLLKEYTLVVAIALIIAAPAWWIIMSNWLNNFNFRITLNPLLFLASGLLLILISWSTLGYQTFTTIRANPVESLKEE
ncbi:MAG: FtsX-like permease family protein, partial [Saprospiraceae bacterium]|nr:FtsX-like permease family protein [Saprospiraceae bacterium]